MERVHHHTPIWVCRRGFSLSFSHKWKDVVIAGNLLRPDNAVELSLNGPHPWWHWFYAVILACRLQRGQFTPVSQALTEGSKAIPEGGGESRPHCGLNVKVSSTGLIMMARGHTQLYQLTKANRSVQQIE